MVGGGRAPLPRHLTHRQEAPPPGTLMPPPQRAKPARISARCGVGDGSPRPHPPLPQPVGSGPRPHARKDEWSGVGERSTRDAPHPGRGRAPRGALVPPRQRAKPARKSARCWICDGSPRPHPPHPQPAGSGPRPHARKHERSGLGERPTPDAPHPGKRRPPWAPSCGPHNAQSQLARGPRCGVGDGPPRRHPPHPQPVGSGPRPHARKEGRSGVGERPTTEAQARGAPPRAPSCRPHSAQSQLGRARAVGFVTGPHTRTPRTHSQLVVGPAARPEGRVVGGGRAPHPGRPTPRQDAPPPGALVLPPQRAKPARKIARSGVRDGSPRENPPQPQPVGSGPRPHARKDEWSGVGERPTPDAPHIGKRRPPRAPSCRPHNAQSQLARARAVEWVTGPHARSPRTHSQWVVGPGRTPQRTSGRG